LLNYQPYYAFDYFRINILGVLKTEGRIGMGDDSNDNSPESAEQTKEKNEGDFFVLVVGAVAQDRISRSELTVYQLEEELLRVKAQLRATVDRARGLLRRVVTAQEDERSRIARNLHDHLGQRLTALRLQLEVANDKGGNQRELNQAIEQAQMIAKQLDADVDFLSWELHPASLDRLQLATALFHFVQEWSKHFDIPAEFHISEMETGRFPRDIASNLYRIAQEALNNIYKHAQATRVDVIFECREDRITLVIEDNGQGFAVNDVAVEGGEDKGIGLIGMRERAALVGGTLEIDSRPGDGTTIIVRAPLPSGEEGDEEGEAS
jgi:signal transduction histidine kinase